MIQLIYFVVSMLNVPVRTFAKGQITNDYSLREIVTRKRFDARKMCGACFGEYVEASQDADVTNDMEQCKDACIAVGPAPSE